jgi:hypothetical protein
MIEYTLDRENSVLHVRPTGPLRKQDFDELAELTFRTRLPGQGVFFSAPWLASLSGPGLQGENGGL